MNVQILPLVRDSVPEAKFHVIGLPDSYRRAIGQMNCADMLVELPLTMSDGEWCAFLNGITVFTHGAALGESFGMSIAEAMASGLIQLLENPELKRQMGRRGKLRAKEWFDAPQIVRQLEDLFTSLFEG